MALHIPHWLPIPPVTLPVARDHICTVDSTLPWDNVGIALLEAIRRKELPVYGVPDAPYAQNWMKSPSVNWATGDATVLRSGAYGLPYEHFTPTIDLARAVAIFEETPDGTGGGAVKGVTGPKPTIREAIKQRMLEALRAGHDVAGLKHEALTSEFGQGAARATCVAALKAALSEFREFKSDKL